MKRIAIKQPTYLPWLGYLELMRRVDTFVLYDHVQFARRSWQQRNRIRDAKGELMLTVPVLVKGKRDQAILEVEIDRSSGIAKKHLRTIEHNCRRAKNFARVFPALEAIYAKEHTLLCELNEKLIRFGREVFEIPTEVVRSRDLAVVGTKVEALIDVCQNSAAVTTSRRPPRRPISKRTTRSPRAGSRSSISRTRRRRTSRSISPTSSAIYRSSTSCSSATPARPSRSASDLVRARSQPGVAAAPRPSARTSRSRTASVRPSVTRATG